MNKEEVVEFMVNSVSSDNEDNMRAMGVAEEQIQGYLETNKPGMEYLFNNLYDRMAALDLFKNE